MKRKKKILDNEKIKQIIKPTKKKVIIAAVIVIAIAGIAVKAGKGKPAGQDTENKTDRVVRGDIDVTITGSAAIEPYERYEIIPKVSGDITYCPYDVGDQVQKGDILYGFDSSNTNLSIERQRISLKQSENSYKDALEESDKLTLKASNSGVISDLTIQVGQEVKNGTKIASVNDTTLLEAEIPFTQAQIDSIHIGDAAQITSSKHMSSVSGTVTHKSSASYAASDGSALYNVTVSFSNPGAFYAGMEVGGSVGGNISPGSGTVKNSSTGDITAETEGTVSRVNYRNGDYVAKGAVIAVLTSDTVSDKIQDSSLSYRSANLSMQQSEKDLEDYNITSPISGTVITKNSKAGDTIDKTNSSTTMMVIADVSRLKFDLEIDELDVSKVSEGQAVSITCDALPNEEYVGYITSVSVEGSAQNGVTTYSAEIVVDEPGNLRPSMNVDATITIESAKNVLTIPTADVKTIGDKNFVFVKDDSKKSDTGSKGKAPTEKDTDQDKKPADAPAGGDAPGSNANPGKNMTPQAPEGYRVQEIETGISNEDYTEVVSGISEGDEIYSQTVSTSDSSNNMMMGAHGGMGGRMGGGPGGGGGMGGGPGGMR